MRPDGVSIEYIYASEAVLTVKSLEAHGPLGSLSGLEYLLSISSVLVNNLGCHSSLHIQEYDHGYQKAISHRFEEKTSFPILHLQRSFDNQNLITQYA